MMEEYRDTEQIKEDLKNAKTNREFFKIYTESKNIPFMSHFMSMFCMTKTCDEELTIREYVCYPNKDKYHTKNSVYVIGKMSPDDEMIYIVKWMYVTKTRRGGTRWDFTFKAYNKSQIEWLIKENRLNVDKRNYNYGK